MNEWMKYYYVEMDDGWMEEVERRMADEVIVDQCNIGSHKKAEPITNMITYYYYLVCPYFLCYITTATRRLAVYSSITI